jgi:uncharacterized protein YkwD
MKKRPVLHQLASFCIAASVFFSGAAAAQANTFNLPQQFTVPGLIFSAPLIYSHPFSSHSSIKISFTKTPELKINKEDRKKPLESIIVTPPIATPEITTANTPETTPTIDVKAVATELETQSPTSTPTPEPTTPANYTPAPQANPGGLNAVDIFGMVNAYRQQQGLPAFQEDPRACTVAQERAPQVAGEVASGTMHAGLKALNLPYWDTENIISMNSDQAAFNWWINDPIHHDAIVSHATYSCIACSGNSCAEEFTSFVAK